MNSNTKTAADIGEFGLIDQIQKLLPEIDHKDVIIGIGDDTAVLRIDDARAMLITCDIQVENQHFRLQNISPYQLGRRAVAVNLSDIAAMGGRPTFALVSLGFPKTMAAADFDDLIKGMRDHLAEFSAFIIGGNLSSTEKDLIIDITMMGEMNSRQCLTRRGAKAGDRIFVSGEPGTSGAGFYMLATYGKACPPELAHLVQKHLQPIPRIEIGQRLAQSGFATAMIDISDGIAPDLNHLCSMSHAGAELYQAKFPLPSGIDNVSSLSGIAPLQFALHSGEDYELLFTMKSNTPASIIKSIIDETGIAITEIGKILPQASGYCMIDSDKNRIPVQSEGWDHFRRKKPGSSMHSIP
ncbi:thiamine-phosphate kinase [candidate division KSB1 bacterium]|nr:thiamine-phosphate kinase [candidate division KSB1 bacterium]